MQVLKRNGKREDVSFDKITARIKKLCYGLDANFVDLTFNNDTSKGQDKILSRKLN